MLRLIHGGRNIAGDPVYQKTGDVEYWKTVKINKVKFKVYPSGYVESPPAPSSTHVKEWICNKYNIQMHTPIGGRHPKGGFTISSWQFWQVDALDELVEILKAGETVEEDKSLHYGSLPF